MYSGREGFAVNINGAGTEHDDADWVRRHWSAIHSSSTGVYVNFLDDEGTARAALAYGPSHRRLAELKRRWDPGNVFRHNHNIAPAGSV